jgi:hemoglobin-like flavoprotein
MKTPITKQIADKLEQLAVQWKDHTSQAEALMMAAKEVMTFQEKEKEMIIDAWIDDRFPLDKEWVKQCAEQYYNETYGGNN